MLLLRGRKMPPKEPDINRFLWMPQMWHYEDKGYWPMQRDYGGKKQKQATQAQDVHVTQPDHAQPQLDRSGWKQ